MQHTYKGLDLLQMQLINRNFYEVYAEYNRAIGALACMPYGNEGQHATRHAPRMLQQILRTG